MTTAVQNSSGKYIVETCRFVQSRLLFIDDFLEAKWDRGTKFRNLADETWGLKWDRHFVAAKIGAKLRKHVKLPAKGARNTLGFAKLTKA
jgi:hypothetical protein